MMVKGSITVYLPKGTTPESIGLVSYRTAPSGDMMGTTSRDMHFRVYDRQTGNRVFAAEYCKVSMYTIAVQARGITEVTMQFDGTLMTPGLTL